MPRKRPRAPRPLQAPDAPPDSAAALEAALRANAALSDDLRRAKQQLSLRAYELHNLVDLTRDLTSSSAEDAIREIVLTTVMGHFVVSRSALYLVGPDGLALASARGLRREAEGPPIPLRALAGLTAPQAVAVLPPGPLRDRLQAGPARARGAARGGRPHTRRARDRRARVGLSFSEEDKDVAQTLARQALAAIENVRLQRVRDEKQRQDRELRSRARSR
jgi:GAF domain-containing protein